MSNIYVIASHVQHAQEKIAEIRAYRTVTQPPAVQETLLIPVFGEPDMRGRKVGPDDTVVVCGDWSSRQVHEVQRLVSMFNSRRDGDRAPELRFRTGEAPEVKFWGPTSREEYPALATDPPPGAISYDPATHTISTFDGNQYFAIETPHQYAIGIETQVPPAAPTATTSAQVAWEQVLDPPQQRIVQDAKDAVKRERAIAEDMRKQVKKAKAEVDQVRAEMKELRSWLSGVLPVEDSEIPGIFYCGCCGRRLPMHLDGCPAAP